MPSRSQPAPDPHPPQPAKRSGGVRSWPVRHTISAGGVVVRTGDDDDPKVAMIRHRTMRGKQTWGLPKGMIEPGESSEEAAIREVGEETGLEAEIVEKLDDVTYRFAWVRDRVRYRKTVHFFLMRMTGGDPSQHDDEVEEVAFFTFDEAIDRSPFASERNLLRHASNLVSHW